MATRGVINVEAIFALGILVVAAARSRAKASGRQTEAAARGGLLDVAAAASAIALVVAAYWRVRDLPFLSDDFILLRIAKDLEIQGFANLFTSGGGDGFFRPLGLISIAWTRDWAGTDPAMWHAVALGLHCLNTILVYALGRALRLGRGWAWFAAILFAVHAAHPEAVVWIAGRFDLLATALALASLTAFLLYCERGSLGWCVAALVAMAGGMLSKESAYAVPVMMTVYAVWRTEARRRTLMRLAPFYAVTVALFAYRWAMQEGIGGYAVAIHPLSLANALLVRIWAVLFFPINWSLGAAWLFPAVIACGLAWSALAWKPEGGRARVLMPATMTIAAALPAAGLLLIGADLEKARVLYLPSAAFCLLAASMMEMAPGKLRIGAAGVILAFQLTALEHNLGIWQEVGKTAAAACEATVKCSNPEAVTGLPATLDGVYFFRNGFVECVRLRQSEQPEPETHTCALSWDAASRTLR